MKKLLLLVAIIVPLVLIGYGNGNAMVSGPCANCHTMHYSQDGSQLPAWGSSGPYDTLLINDCLGCHSSSTTSTYYEINGLKYPVVLYTGGAAPATYLAGGNFWWVKEGLGGDDTKGHNVFLSEPDDNLVRAPGDPARSFCGSNNCHASLSTIVDAGLTAHIGRQGCTKCHMMSDSNGPSGYHHADDSNTVVGSDLDDTDGYYRFLTGHEAADGHGVSGIEDDVWEANPSTSEHNEYLGLSLNKEARVDGMLDPNYHTMTIYCCGCHGNFHIEQSGGGAWIRHPSDSVIPDRDEYSDAYGAGGSGTGVYDPQVPVARDDLTGWTGPSATVTIGGTDMVMCLSCHRTHASPYPDMLRWDYDTMVAGGGGSGGCFTCHTQKD